MTAVGPASSSQAGFTIVEMIITMVILSVILGGLTTIFVQGNNAETDLNQRFQSQQQVRLAISEMRNDGHSACNAALTGSSSVLLYYWDDSQSMCPTSESGPSWSNASCTTTLCLTWCTRGSGSRYALYRIPGASSCGASGGTKEADYLTTGNIFTYTAGTSSGTDAHDLSLLYLDVPVNTRTTKQGDKYEVTDVIVLRNATRS